MGGGETGSKYNAQAPLAQNHRLQIMPCTAPQHFPPQECFHKFGWVALTLLPTLKKATP